ncbi:hypothetical protein GCM10025861_11250 [Methanobacterium petrolearium]|nr:hypothetical protein GCM10025861_11250 [Methanobacterium petrolearium]
MGSASRYLKILEKEELVLKEEKGKLTIYKANMESPLLKELKIIFTMMEIDEMIKDLKNISSRIILFGSCAEGEDHNQSDIDLLILSDKEKEVNRVLDQHQNMIQRKISPVILNDTGFRELSHRDKPFYLRIKKGRILYEIPV